MTDKYTAYILVDFPDIFDCVDYKAIAKKILSSDSNLSLPFTRNGIDLGVLKLELTSIIPSTVRDVLKSHPRLMDNEFLKISFDLTSEKKQELYLKSDRESLDQLILHRIMHVMVVCDLAIPGMLEWLGGSLLQNGDIIMPIQKYFIESAFAYERSIKLNWPIIEFLKIDEVWEWYFKHETGLTMPSTTPIERALNAFSQTYSSSGEWEFGSIFWVLLGLEALYCTGNTNLQGQLVEKTELFLGERTAFKKEVGRMYDFRSRFVHGNINFPNKFSYDDISDEWDKYIVSYQSSFHLALAILLATIQKLIKTNKHNLNFKFILNEDEFDNNINNMRVVE